MEKVHKDSNSESVVILDYTMDDSSSESDTSAAEYNFSKSSPTGVFFVESAY